MPQTQTEKRETAKRLYVESGGKITLKEIAEKLGVPPSTVSSWKKADKWDSQLKRKPRRKKRPGSKGNQRAAKPHPSQEGNKNALKTGRYEEIKYSTMTDAEKALIEEVMGQKSKDQIQMQIALIAELEVRERRMYERAETMRRLAEKDREGLVADKVTISTKGIAKENGKPPTGGIMTADKQKLLGIDKMQDIDIALSAVQKQKQQAILALHRLTEDQTTRDIEKKRLELETRRVQLMERRFGLDPEPVHGEAVQTNESKVMDVKEARRRMSAMTDEQLEQYERLCALFAESEESP